MDSRLEELLRDCAANVAWPPTPPVANRVLVRLKAGAAESNGHLSNRSLPDDRLVPTSTGAEDASVPPRRSLPRQMLAAMAAALAFAVVATLLVLLFRERDSQVAAPVDGSPTATTAVQQLYVLIAVA